MTSIIFEDSQLQIHTLVVGPFENNVYILQCKTTGESLLIDAANEHERLLDLCKLLDVRNVVETHGHWDHIQAVPAIRDAGYNVGIAQADSEQLSGYDYLLEDTSCISVGKLRLHTIATPGHTPGSLCFFVDGVPILFSGDTLFPGGPGTTKLEGGDFKAIMKSIDERLFKVLPKETLVLPGHGAQTTLGIEMPSFDTWLARGW